jgi:hypothetical protein
MRLLAKVAALSALAAVGVVLAVALPAQGHGLATTTDTTTEATGETTTAVSTVAETTTVVTTLEQTTTHQIIVPTLPTTTAEESSSDNGTAAWIWVLLAILGVGLIVFAILLARRGGGGQTVAPEERRRRLDNAVGSWVAQGWAIESQDADSAVLRRVDDLVLVHVDAAGHVSARPFGA